MINIYSKKTGKTPDEIRERYFDGKDHFLTAQEAKDYGFIDEVIEDVFDIPLNIAASAKDKKTYFISQSTTKTTEKVMEKPLKKIADFYGVAETEEAILAKLETERTEKMALLIGLAKQKGFDEDKIALLEISNYDKAKEIVLNAKSIQTPAVRVPIPSITSNPEQSEQKEEPKGQVADVSAFTALMNAITANAPKTETEDKSKWTLNEWQEKDPNGLVEMHDNDPKKYAALAKTYVSPAKKR